MTIPRGGAPYPVPVDESATPARVRPSDALVGAGLATVGVVETFGSHLAHRPLSLAVSLLLGVAVSLAAWSLWVPVAATALLLPALTIGGVSLNDTFVPLFVVVVVSYLAASRANGRQRTLMLAVLLAAMVVAVVTDTRPVPSNLVFGGVMVLAPALAGSAVATRQRLVEVLQAQTRLLEQQRAGEAAAAVAAERLRIARELHDVVAHGLSTMGVQVGAVRRHLRDDQRTERDMLLSVEQTGRTALDDMHRMLGLLRDGEAGSEATTRIPQPGLARLDDLVAEARRGGLDVSVCCTGDLTDLPATLELTVYRVVQEALTNVRKHSAARAATVRLDRDGELRIRVMDPGPSSLTTVTGAGLGLLGMQERVAAHHGEFHAGPVPESPGFMVDVRLPVAPREVNA